MWRRRSDGLGKEGELFVEQLGLNKDVLHPALPLRHKGTPRQHGRTVNTDRLSFVVNLGGLLAHLPSYIKKSLNVTASYCGPGRERKQMLRIAPIFGLHLVPRLRMSGVIPLLPPYAFLVCICTTVPLPVTNVYGSHG